jgi:DNA primase
MNLTSLLSQILGDYKEVGKGEHYFACPFCHHQKKKFAINIDKHVFHCWHCGARGRSFISLFRRLDAHPSQIKELRELLSETHLTSHGDDTDTPPVLRLPREFIPLWKPSPSFAYTNAVRYLKDRNINGYDIIRYQLGYVTEGPYANRIIVPSYDASNKLNYFIARSFFDDRLKYKNPPVSKNVVMFENQINWRMPIILCEGVFDAIAIRRNVIPLLGKFVPTALLTQLVVNKVKDVYVVLDSDAKFDALEMERTLAAHGITAKLVSLGGKDPSELGFVSTWEAIQRGMSTSFKEYIQFKVNFL